MARSVKDGKIRRVETGRRRCRGAARVRWRRYCEHMIRDADDWRAMWSTAGSTRSSTRWSAAYATGRTRRSTATSAAGSHPRIGQGRPAKAT